MVKKIPKQVVKKKEAETQGATRKKKKMYIELVELKPTIIIVIRNVH